jgi:hypothetical protein
MGWGWALAWAAAAAYVAAKLMEVLWWRPRRVEEHFARQGIRGPRYRFFVGCVREMVALMVAATAKPMPRPYRSHNVLPRVLAFYHHWRKIYGKEYITQITLFLRFLSLLTGWRRTSSVSALPASGNFLSLLFYYSSTVC